MRMPCLSLWCLSLWCRLGSGDDGSGPPPAPIWFPCCGCFGGRSVKSPRFNTHTLPLPPETSPAFALWRAIGGRLDVQLVRNYRALNGQLCDGRRRQLGIKCTEQQHRAACRRVPAEQSPSASCRADDAEPSDGLSIKQFNSWTRCSWHRPAAAACTWHRWGGCCV